MGTLHDRRQLQSSIVYSQHQGHVLGCTGDAPSAEGCMAASL